MGKSSRVVRTAKHGRGSRKIRSEVKRSAVARWLKNSVSNTMLLKYRFCAILLNFVKEIGAIYLIKINIGWSREVSRGKSRHSNGVTAQSSI